MRIVVMGSGTSYGVPNVGCDCPVCSSEDPRDKRMRSSVYIEGDAGERVLIDAGPEFRLQAVRAGIKRLDGIFLTHAHADHIHGLDDVRPLSRNNPLPIYGNEPTIKEMKERFSYIWSETQVGGGKPRLTPQVVGAFETVKTGNLAFTPIPVKHGILDIFGWEIRENTPAGNPGADGRSFLYLTDVSDIPPAASERLKKESSGRYRIIIIGGLRIKPHETHFNFTQAIEAAVGLGAEEIYITHICHNSLNSEIEEFCRNFRETRQISAKIHPAWDGLELVLRGD